MVLEKKQFSLISPSCHLSKGTIEYSYYLRCKMLRFQLFYHCLKYNEGLKDKVKGDYGELLLSGCALILSKL